jgi:hypothetical protein
MSYIITNNQVVQMFALNYPSQFQKITKTWNMFWVP